MILDLAWKLHKEPVEVREMDQLTFTRWVAFFSMIREAEDARMGFKPTRSRTSR